jgi:hypothetical protein
MSFQYWLARVLLAPGNDEQISIEASIPRLSHASCLTIDNSSIQSTTYPKIALKLQDDLLFDMTG